MANTACGPLNSKVGLPIEAREVNEPLQRTEGFRATYGLQTAEAL